MGRISESDFQLMMMRLDAGKKRPDAPYEAQDGPESLLHEMILSECKRRQWICFHGSMAHRARRTIGEPDCIILADRGRVFFIEAKRKGGKLSPEQLGLKLWAERLGTSIHTVYSFEQFLEVINQQPTTT